MGPGQRNPKRSWLYPSSRIGNSMLLPMGPLVKEVGGGIDSSDFSRNSLQRASLEKMRDGRVALSAITPCRLAREISLNTPEVDRGPRRDQCKIMRSKRSEQEISLNTPEVDRGPRRDQCKIMRSKRPDRTSTAEQEISARLCLHARLSLSAIL